MVASISLSVARSPFTVASSLVIDDLIDTLFGWSWDDASIKIPDLCKLAVECGIVGDATKDVTAQSMIDAILSPTCRTYTRDELWQIPEYGTALGTEKSLTTDAC